MSSNKKSKHLLPDYHLRAATGPYNLRSRKNRSSIREESVVVQENLELSPELFQGNHDLVGASFLQPRVVLEDISHLCAAVEPKELDSQVNTHSTDPLLARDKGYLKTLPEKQGIRWPAMNEEAKWNSFSDAVCKQIYASNNLSVGARVSLLESAIYDVASVHFGHVAEKKRLIPHFVYKKQRTIELVQIKNKVSLEIKSCMNSLESQGLTKILESTKSELRNLRKKGNKRKRRWIRNKERRSFKANPYRCGKDLLTPKNFCKLSIPMVEMDKHLKALHSDPSRDLPLPPLEGLPSAPDIKMRFDASDFSVDDFSMVLKSRRNASKPGPK